MDGQDEGDRNYRVPADLTTGNTVAQAGPRLSQKRHVRAFLRNHICERLDRLLCLGFLQLSHYHAHTNQDYKDQYRTTDDDSHKYPANLWI